MAQDLGGLVYSFEDQTAYLETTLLHFFVEVLRNSLLVGGHSEISMVSHFLNQI